MCPSSGPSPLAYQCARRFCAWLNRESMWPSSVWSRAAGRGRRASSARNPAITRTSRKMAAACSIAPGLSFIPITAKTKRRCQCCAKKNTYKEGMATKLARGFARAVTSPSRALLPHIALRTMSCSMGGGGPECSGQSSNCKREHTHPLARALLSEAHRPRRAQICRDSRLRPPRYQAPESPRPQRHCGRCCPRRTWPDRR